MADYKLNDNQLDFINTLDKNVLVSASAGSGKTTTMIQKLIKILLDLKEPITSLLVVTYTNAAASEMRQKLYNELNKIILTITNPDDKSFLKEQLDNISNTEIGTLHAICRKIIVKYFYEIDESPDFGLVMDKEQKYLKDMAINNVFNKHIKMADKEFFELFDCYNSNRSDVTLKSIVLKLYEYKVAKTNYYNWREDFLNSTYSVDLNQNIACQYVLDYYQKELLQFSPKLHSVRNTASTLGLDKYLMYLDVRLQFIDEFCKSKDFATSVKILDSAVFPSKPTKGKNMSPEESDFDSTVDETGKSFGKLIETIKKNYTSTDIDQIQNNITYARNNVIKIMDIVDEFEENYSSIKRNKNVLDFNDLEDKMILLLKNDKIRKLLKEQYKYVFVDEYQDINDKQEEILLQLVSDNNFNMIGDVKQSIYAFRQSSPEIFINKYNDFSSNNPNSKVIKFNINYRSDKNILEFCNDIFDVIITRSTIGIDYINDARFESTKEIKESNVTLNIVRNNDELKDKDLTEAKLIAEEIRRLMTLTKNDGTNFDYEDIAIIIKERGEFLNVLCDTLSKLEIPVKTSMYSDFFETSEIKLLCGILKCVSNYKDDVSLVVVLKNLFNFTENELMQICSYDGKVNFYDAVLEYNKDDSISRRIKECFDFLSNSRILLSKLTLSEYIMKVIDDFDILLKLKVRNKGAEKVNNVEDFIKILDNDNYKYNLDKFLDYLDIISKDKSAKVVGDNNNAVEICTIHHSKGLEYPAVILSRLGQKFQINKDSDNIIINSKFGVGLKSIDSDNRTIDETIIRNACKIDNKKSQLNENIRLLYVAMTRAKEKLSLVGVYDLDKYAENKQKNVYTSQCLFDMIFKGIDKVYNSSFVNLDKFIINKDKNSEASVRIFNATDFEDDLGTNTNQVILDSGLKTLSDNLQNVFNNKPKFNKTTIKNSVTNILKEETDYENLNFVPEKLDITDKVLNADVLKLGTAYHSIMQYINFAEDMPQLENLVEKLVKEEVIDKTLVSSIKLNEIMKAIEIISPIINGSKKVYKEKQFLLCENYNKLIKSTDNNTKVIVQGVIDLVVVRENDVYLIDYKTNRGVTPEILADEYRVQLNLYQKAFEEATSLKVTKKFLYSFYLGKLVEVD